MRKSVKRFLGDLAFGVSTLFYGKRGKLLSACKRGKTRQALKLLDKGADVNARDTVFGHCNTPLILACWKNHTELVKRLIERCEDLGLGIDINARNSWGRSAFFWACKNNNTELALKLLERGADVDFVDENLESPLYWVCKRGNIRLTCEIESKIADCGKESPNFSLHMCASRGNRQLIKALDMGVNVNRTANDEMTLSNGTTFLGHHINQYIKLCDYRRDDDRGRERHEQLKFILTIIKEGADVNAVDRYSYRFFASEEYTTPLGAICNFGSLWCWRGSRLLALRLIAAGAHICERSAENIEAERSKKLESLKLLVKKQGEILGVEKIESEDQMRMLIDFILSKSPLMCAKQASLAKLIDDNRICGAIDKELLENLFKKIVFNYTFVHEEIFKNIRTVALENDFVDRDNSDVIQAMVLHHYSFKSKELKKMLHEKLVNTAPEIFLEVLDRYIEAAKKVRNKKLFRGLCNMGIEFRDFVYPKEPGLFGGKVSHIPPELVISKIFAFSGVTSLAEIPYIDSRKNSFRYRQSVQFERNRLRPRQVKRSKLVQIDSSSDSEDLSEGQDDQEGEFFLRFNKRFCAQKGPVKRSRPRPRQVRPLVARPRQVKRSKLVQIDSSSDSEDLSEEQDQEGEEQDCDSEEEEEIDLVTTDDGSSRESSEDAEKVILKRKRAPERAYCRKIQKPGEGAIFVIDIDHKYELHKYEIVDKRIFFNLNLEDLPRGSIYGLPWWSNRIGMDKVPKEELISVQEKFEESGKAETVFLYDPKKKTWEEE